MSAQGYADRLSEFSHKGKLNLQSEPDPPRSILAKARLLAERIRTSSHVVLHTGAGISTAAGIRDFRGPDGVWTAEARGVNGVPSGPSHPGISFEDAAPTLTHMAITALHATGLIHYVISQNVDGLHLRSGLPRSALSELHGNLFVDWCPSCSTETRRDGEVTTVGYTPSGRACTRPDCDGVLTDKALDWEDALPQADLDAAKEHSDRADLALVVGTSCQMEPARGLPWRGKAEVGIVNLSRTEYDGRAAFTVRARADAVFAVLVRLLDVRLGVYEREMEVVFRSVVEGEMLRVEMCVQWDGEVKRRKMREVSRVQYRTKGSWTDGDDSAGYAARVCGSKGACVEGRVSLRDGLGEVVGEHVGPGWAVCRAVVRREKYSERVEEEIRRLEAGDGNGRKRKRLSREWEARKWFVRGRRRGWQVCANCGAEVWSGSGKREAHAAECVG